MRPILTFMVLMFATNSLVGQDDVNKKQMVGFGCYFAGEPTQTVAAVTELLMKKKYKAISDLLKTGDEAEKFLATVSLEKLSALGRYELSDNDKQLIKKVKSSDEKVSVCSGCTYFDRIALKDMFSDNNFLGSNWWIEKILIPDSKNAPQQKQ